MALEDDTKIRLVHYKDKDLNFDQRNESTMISTVCESVCDGTIVRIYYIYQTHPSKQSVHLHWKFQVQGR